MLPIIRARANPDSQPTSSTVGPVDPLARIWITYKTRILSEQRYRLYALISHLALTWYAFLSIVFSIYQNRIAESLQTDGASQASLMISVLTFGLSLVIYGFRFEDNARTHRDCYLKMQSVYQSIATDDDKLEQYRNLLEHFPNHSNRDYQTLLLDGWRAGRTLYGTDGKAIKFSVWDATREYIVITAFWLIISSIFVVPFGLIIYWTAVV